MSNLPPLRKAVKIKFWSLRNGLGPNLGVISDIDTEVTKIAYRKRNDDEWKWQIRGYNKIKLHDPSVITDQETLDENGEDMSKITILELN